MGGLKKFQEMDRRERRRLGLRSAARIIGTTVGLLVLYAVVPVPGESGLRALLEMLAGLALFGVLVVWQIVKIVEDDHPQLRAVESLAVAFPVLVLLFSFTYLSLSHANPTDFSTSLNHISALYFTVTIVGTVGFGDITPRTDLARVLVTVQILLDLIVFVGIARTVVFAARLGVSRRDAGG